MFVCCNCRRKRFSDQVYAYKEHIKSGYKNNIGNQCVSIPEEICMTNNKFHICFTCHTYFVKGKIPPMSHINQLKTVDLTNMDDIRELNPLENTLIALNIPFQLIYKTSVSRWNKTKRQLVNIPIPHDKMMSTVASIPRTPEESPIVNIYFKRKKSMTSSHCEQYVNIERIYAVLEQLRQLGNPFYQDVNIDRDAYTDRYLIQQQEGLDKINLTEGSLEEIAVIFAALHVPPLNLIVDSLPINGCLFTACIHQLGRPCFEKATLCTADELRLVTTIYLKNCTAAYEMSGLYKRKWLRDLDIFGKTGKWTCCNRTVLLLGICVSLKKRILIINTVANQGEPPTYVICPSVFGGDIDSGSPLVFAHDGDIFKSFSPTTDIDEDNLIELIEQHVNGTYNLNVRDLNIDTYVTNKEKRGGQEQENVSECIEIIGDSDDDENYETNDPIQRQKFTHERPTLLVNDHPQNDVRDTVIESESDDISRSHKNEPVVVAPGENIVPTNILTEDFWEAKSFPCLFPDGQYTFHHQKRQVKLTMQKYFEQRILNIDGRFALNPSYVFSAFGCNEKNVLERNYSIAFQRGKRKEVASGGIQYTGDNPYCILEKSPGTPMFWQKKNMS